MSDYRAFSDIISPRIQGVIEEELSKQGGGMMTGMIAIFTYIDEEGNQCWSRVGEVPVIQAVGMVDILQMSVRAEAAHNMGLSG